MSTFNYSYTIAFPKDTKIKIAQACEALRIKCREPMKFVPVITACEMFEETPMSFKRKITLDTGDTAIEEGVFYAPSLVTFRGDIGGYITNVLSEDANGSLYLTFTFAMPLHSTVTGSGEEIAEKKWVRDLATGTSEKSLKSILKMFDGGLLN